LPVLEVRPFQAVRYAAVDSLGSVIAPPYDVISPSEQDALYERDPHNVIRLELARGSSDEPLAGRYAFAAESLRLWRRRNILGRDSTPAMYPYEERFRTPNGDLTRRGVFAIVRLRPWEDGAILPHERTRPRPKADRLELLHTCRTQFSPIFSLYEDPDGTIQELLHRACRGVPIACAQVRPGASPEIAENHQLWRVTGGDAERLGALFAHRELFIADGHHRYETALEYLNERQHTAGFGDSDHPARFVMMLLVSVEDPGLRVLPTHRMVSLPSDAPWDDPFHSELFACEGVPSDVSDDDLYRGLLARRSEGPIFGVVGPGEGRIRYARVRRIPEPWSAPATWRELDVGLLQTFVIDTLEQGHPGTEIAFTRDPGEARRHAQSDPARMSVLVAPTDVRHIVQVARARERMPEKSTYFAPKVATGMVMYRLG